MDLQQFKDFIEKQNWTFAKTYAQKAPHEYIVRGKHNGTDEEYTEAVQFVHDHGFPAYWYRNCHTYYSLEGRYYWNMGEPASQTKILNRCLHDDYLVSMRTKPK